MREIKFRAWDKSEQNFIYFDALYGILSEVDETYRLFNVGQFEQYTGLKDKNGKEIYEGDIVSLWEDGYEDEKTTGKVVYLANHDYPAFDIWPQVDCESNTFSHYKAVGCIEIIGNIHKEQNK